LKSAEERHESYSYLIDFLLFFFVVFAVCDILYPEGSGEK